MGGWGSGILKTFLAPKAPKIFMSRRRNSGSNIGNVLKTVRNERGTSGEPQKFPLRGPADVYNQIRGWYASVKDALDRANSPAKHVRNLWK